MRNRDLGVLVYDREKGTPGNYAYLLPNGNLLWSGRTEEGPPLRSGKGGLLHEYDWSGKAVWEFRDPAHHHDLRRTANERQETIWKSVF